MVVFIYEQAIELYKKFGKRSNKMLTGTRRKASSISSFIRPFFSKNDRLWVTGEPLTFRCDKNFTALWICASRNGSEFTNTDVSKLCLPSSSPLLCWSTFSVCSISPPTPWERDPMNQINQHIQYTKYNITSSTEILNSHTIK